MKYLLLFLTLLFPLLPTRADTPVNILFSGSEWSSDWANEDFYWYPDQGPDFDVKIYTHTMDGSNRLYNNYTTRAYGGYDWSFNDPFNTYTTQGSPARFVHVFFLFRYHYSAISFDNAYGDWPYGWPQAFAVVNMWHPSSQQWFSYTMYPATGEYWCLWVCHYNAYQKNMWTEKIAAGSSYNYPSDISAWWSYGQW